MAENNRAIVKIYGQQYTIAGAASSDDMERVAGYVDDVMNKLAKSLPSLSTLSLAVLAAVNTTSDYFEAVRVNQKQSEQIESMKEDAERYSMLWEDAKASLQKYQEETRNGVEQLQDLQRIFNKKNVELNKMKEALDEMTSKYEEAEKKLSEAEVKMTEMMERQPADGDSSEKVDKLEEEKAALQKKVAQLEEQLQKTKNSKKSESQSLSDFREKYKELENSFFDIQMENITLKNELDEFRKNQ